MDPCNPESNVDNVRSALRTKLGVPKSYASKFSRQDACTAFRTCKKSNVFPSLKLDKAGGYIYFIDPESPLSAKQYRILFERGTVEQVRSIAKKLKVTAINKPKRILKANIVGILSGLGLREPIKAMKITDAKNNLFTPNKNNPFTPIPTNNKNNLFASVPTNNKNNLFTPIPTNNKNTNKLGPPVINMKNAQISATDESEPFTLGKPIVKAPRGLSENSVTSKLNTISNNLSYISERAE